MVIMAGRRWLRAAFVNNLLNQQRLSRQQKALVPTLTGKGLFRAVNHFEFHTKHHDMVSFWRGQ